MSPNCPVFCAAMGVAVWCARGPWRCHDQCVGLAQARPNFILFQSRSVTTSASVIARIMYSERMVRAVAELVLRVSTVKLT